jgi:hypothetical protein
MEKRKGVRTHPLLVSKTRNDGYFFFAFLAAFFFGAAFFAFFIQSSWTTRGMTPARKRLTATTRKEGR